MIRGAKLQTRLRIIFKHVRSFWVQKMSSKSNGLSVSPGTALSLFCLLLYYAGFVRIELKLNDHDQRLTAIEEVISQMKHGMADTWNESKVLFKSKISCSPVIRLSIVSVTELYYEIC